MLHASQRKWAGQTVQARLTIVPNTTSASAAEASVALRVAVGRLRRRLREVTNGDDLSSAQVSVLSRLVNGEADSAAALSAVEGVRPQSMAATLASLEQLGLVARRPDPADGRRQLVSLTRKGRSAATFQKQVRGEWLARRLDEVCTERERQLVIAAAAVLERVAGT